MMQAKDVRVWALVGTIITDLLMLLFWILSGHWGFFWCFICINVSVLIWEVINNFFLYGKTLSTEVKDKIEKGGEKRIYSYLAILFMFLSIAFLAVHLGWVEWK